MFHPIRKIRLSDGVFAQILKLIENGTIKPGDQLPAEREIAESLQVSRSSVREAIRSLETLGFLESRAGAGGGSCVREITLKNLLLPFSSMLLQQGVDILKLLEVRCILETAIAGLAAKRRTDEDLKRIEMSNDEMAEEIDKGLVGLSGNNNFHEYLAKATQNDILMQIQHMFSELLSKVKNDILQRIQKPKKSLEEHKRIYLAVKERDAVTASQLMKQHILEARKNIIERE